MAQSSVESELQQVPPPLPRAVSLPVQVETTASKAVSLKNLLSTTMGQQQQQTVDLKPLSIEAELQNYLQLVSPGNPVSDFTSFWSQHQSSLPRLSQLARKFNIVPATSVCSERTFSKAGFVSRKQRTRLTSASLQSNMVLKGQMDVVQNLSR